MSSVIEDIMTEGWEKGREDGKVEKEREIAEKMIKDGIQIDIVSHYCSYLKKNDLLDMQNEILKSA